MNHHDNIDIKIHEKNIGILNNFIDTLMITTDVY